MDIKNSPIVKHAINNDKSLLPGIIAYSCKEAMVMAKRECGDFIDFAKEWIQSSKQLCEEENIPWEQIRAATGDSIDNYIIISFPSKRESDESLKITTKLHCDLARYGGVTLNQY